ncbi:lysozyme inhibitor LprI family protein [Aestuariirhabdus sp. Z084]|uniref:lysozyme inhibitor LprI family protein n=1 Tax=Aestuariirhabdus haliotis TaxID=2918751 RepID=UPI00201B3A3E|nr:lysozyme inhibitor LprI family protein [Aestuariirhabdus haliotis]MCL6416803.1 lysozyme inhibitor LprI family protein [Aestuariirhabdus haliotis]MCL6420803.1 lysozyme inhibitor LprI family protein [Aestuariirhabdus haliotis]
MKTTLYALLLSLVVLPAHAAVKQSQLRALERQIVEEKWPACVSPRNYYDRVYCSSKVYNLLDTSLNERYIALRKTLSDGQKQRLKKVQVAWIRERDDQCASIQEDSVIMDLGCTKARTVESLYYITEMNKNPQDFDLLLQEYKRRE